MAHRDEMLHGIVVSRSRQGDILAVITKEGKYLINRSSRIHSGRAANVGDFLIFQPRPLSHKKSDELEGLVDEYKVAEQLPDRMTIELSWNKQGNRVLTVSCELKYTGRQNSKGQNIFDNQWLGEILDEKGIIQCPLPDEPYRCSVLRAFTFENDPKGAWLLSYVQYQPVSLLKGPFVGFLYELPIRITFVWCVEFEKVLFVSSEPMRAFGYSNVGRWVNFYLDDKEEVKRMELLADNKVKTTKEGGKYMSTLPCEFREDRTDEGCAVWRNTLVDYIIDKTKVTSPASGDTAVLWCYLDLSVKGNEEWVVERVEEMEREQRNETVDKVEIVETGQRKDEEDDRKSVCRNERVESRQSQKMIEEWMENGQKHERVEDTEGRHRRRSERLEEVERAQRNERIESRQSHGKVEDVERRQRKGSERVDEKEYRRENHHINGISDKMKRMTVDRACRPSLTMSPPPSVQGTSSSLFLEETLEENDGPSLRDICRQLFKNPDLRKVALNADPVLYAQLMEKLNGF